MKRMTISHLAFAFLVFTLLSGCTRYGTYTDVQHSLSSHSYSQATESEVGGRKGWSVPMREQQASLVDDDNSSPALPTDHPFLNVQSTNYWSATTNAPFPTFVWFVNFGAGGVFNANKGLNRLAWCVRGGQSFDGNTHDTLH